MPGFLRGRRRCRWWCPWVAAAVQGVGWGGFLFVWPGKEPGRSPAGGGGRAGEQRLRGTFAEQVGGGREEAAGGEFETERVSRCHG